MTVCASLWSQCSPRFTSADRCTAVGQERLQPQARPGPQAPPGVRGRAGGRDMAGLRAGCDFVQMASDF